MTLDGFSLALGGAATAALSTAVFAILWHKWKQLSLACWAVASAAVFLSLVREIVVTIHPPTVPSILGNTVTLALLSIFVMAVHAGIKTFDNKPLNVALLLAATALAPLAYLIAIGLGLLPTVAYGVGFLCVAPMAIGTAAALVLAARPHAQSWPRMLAGATMGVYALGMVAAGLIRVGIASETKDLPAPVLITINQLVGMVLFVALIAMIALRRRVALDDLANTDPLTRLGNRRAMERDMEALDSSASASVTVLMIDIDHFKAVNDTHGHAAGDAVLRELATRGGQFLNAVGGRMYRYGGEEFVGVVPAQSLDGSVETAEELRKRVESEAFTIDAQDLKVTVSIGIAICTPHDFNIGRALHRADALLYEAKRRGRNRVEA